MKVDIRGMPASSCELTTQQRLRLLRVIRESFERQCKKLRTKQYQLAAQLLQRLDKEKAEKLLQSINL